jgi:hypothetical protein
MHTLAMKTENTRGGKDGEMEMEMKEGWRKRETMPGKGKGKKERENDTTRKCARGAMD